MKKKEASLAARQKKGLEVDKLQESIATLKAEQTELEKSIPALKAEQKSAQTRLNDAKNNLHQSTWQPGNNGAFPTDKEYEDALESFKKAPAQKQEIIKNRKQRNVDNYNANKKALQDKKAALAVAQSDEEKKILQKDINELTQAINTSQSYVEKLSRDYGLTGFSK